MKTILYLTFALGLALNNIHAATRTWSGPNNGLWNSGGGGGNWSGAPVPTAADDVVFPALGGYRSIDLSGLSFTVNSVTFNSPTPDAYLLYSGTLQINSYIEQANSAYGSFTGVTLNHGPAITYQATGAGTGPVHCDTMTGSPAVTITGGYFWWQPTSALTFTPTTLAVSGATAYLRISATNNVIFSGAMTISAGGAVCKEYDWSVLTAPSCALTTGGQLKVAGPISMVSASIASSASLVAGCSISTANVTGDISYGTDAAAEFELGAPNIVGSGVNDLISVTGDLTIDGILKVVPLPGFGIGTYRLFNYTGSLTDGGVVLHNIPMGFKATIDTSTIGQVNLVVAVAPTLGAAFSGGNITLSWSDPTYHLQATPSLSPASWTAIIGTSPVTLPMSGDARFFRLISP